MKSLHEFSHVQFHMFEKIRFDNSVSQVSSSFLFPFPPVVMSILIDSEAQFDSRANEIGVPIAVLTALKRPMD